MFKKYFIFFFIFISFFTVFLSTNNNTTNNLNSYYYPTDYTHITSNFGHRILWGKDNFHTGTDFGAPQGSKIYSIFSGVITHVGFIPGYGNTIIITHENGYKSLYAHVSEYFIVYQGEYVNAHQYIANVGPLILSNGTRNGNTTGPHLHLTIYDNNNKLIDPMSLNLKNFKN